MLNWFYKQREYIISFMAIFFLFIGSANATTLIKKNTASTFTYQAVKNDGTPLTSLTNIEMFYSQHFDTGTCTALTSFGSPSTDKGYGIYFGTITAAMANCDYLVIVPTSSTTGFCQYPKNFRTTIADPHFMAATDDGDDIHTTAGAIDNVTTITTYTGNTPQTGDNYAILTDTWTVARANKLDYLDALISSRMATFSYTVPDNTNITNIYNILTSTWTATRANKIDFLDALISSRGTSTYAGADTAGTTTLLSRVSAARAGYFDYLVDISSGVTRLDLDYTTARAASITAIETDTAAMDTATELRTLLTGADVPVSTTTPTAIWAFDISANNEPTAGGYVISGSTVAGSGATAQQVWEYAGGSGRTLSTFGFSVTVDSTTAAAQADIRSVLIGQGVTTTRAGYWDKLNITGTLANTDNASSFKADTTTITGDVVAGLQAVAADFKADVSALATAEALATAQADLDNPNQYKADTTTIPSATAALILATPVYKLATDSTGRVTVGSNADKTGYTASTVSDKTGYSLAAAQEVTVSSFTSNGQADIQEALTNQGLTTTRNGYLDYLVNMSTGITNIDANMVQVSTWTPTRANNLDYLDAAISGITATVAVADIQAGLNANGYTAARGAYLDYLDMAISDVTATVSVADIQAGMTAQGYTADRAVYLDTIPTIYTKLDLVYTYTNGTKDTGVWNGIESLIRGAR